MTATIAQLLSRATRLRDCSDSWQLDTELLLAEAMAVSREYLRTWPERQVADDATQRFEKLFARRVTGEPLAYILGRREFWDFQLEVNAHVLIPRPETELLVESALALIEVGACQAGDIVDLGTGSGAIAIALARELPHSRVIAIDASAAALEVAQRNATSLALSNIHFSRSSWCAGLSPQSADLLVANPPYVAAGDAHLQQGDLRFEPATALVGAGDGLGDIRTIAAQACVVLREGGWLLVEHGYAQGQAVAEIFAGQGYTAIANKKDYAGNDRLTLGQWPGARNPHRQGNS